MLLIYTYDSRRDVHIYITEEVRSFLIEVANREKKQTSIHSKKKKKKRKREKRRETRGSTQCLPPSPVPPSKVSCLCLLSWLSHTSLLPTYRPIPTDILPLVSSYIHGPTLFSRTVLSVELDEIQNTDTM